MKCTVLCFVLIGFCSGIPLVLGETFEYECDILQRLDYLEAKDKETSLLLLNLDNELNTAKEVIATLERKLTEQLQGQSVGFTMKLPRASPTPGQLKFEVTLSNVGGGYNVTTGVFTCSIPGYYYFSASLLKIYNYESPTYCHIYKNNIVIGTAYTYPSPTDGHTGAFAAVDSVYVHLDTGDNVALASCSPIASFQGPSTFSGFLVTADVI